MKTKLTLLTIILVFTALNAYSEMYHIYNSEGEALGCYNNNYYYNNKIIILKESICKKYNLSKIVNITSQLKETQLGLMKKYGTQFILNNCIIEKIINEKTIQPYVESYPIGNEQVPNQNVQTKSLELYPIGNEQVPNQNVQTKGLELYPIGDEQIPNQNVQTKALELYPIGNEQVPNQNVRTRDLVRTLSTSNKQLISHYSYYEYYEIDVEQAYMNCITGLLQKAQELADDPAFPYSALKSCIIDNFQYFVVDGDSIEDISRKHVLAVSNCIKTIYPQLEPLVTVMDLLTDPDYVMDCMLAILSQILREQ